MFIVHLTVDIRRSTAESRFKTVDSRPGKLLNSSCGVVATDNFCKLFWRFVDIFGTYGKFWVFFCILDILEDFWKFGLHFWITASRTFQPRQYRTFEKLVLKLITPE